MTRSNHPTESRPNAKFRLGWGMLALVVLLAGTGCDQSGKVEVLPETEEKAFHDAQQLMKEDRPKDALASYLRVIKKRPDDAPESHLEAGQLYLKVEQNPVAAIYHFQEYLAVKPNSEQAPMVNQLIDTAKKEFARTLPGQPMRSDYERLDLLDKIKSLNAENEQLRRQLAGHPSVVAVDNAPPVPTPAPTRGATLVPTLPPPPARGAPTPATTPGRGTPTPGTPSSASTRGAPPPVAASAGPRTYPVVKGDTLSNISNKMYGTPNRWQEIFNANRDQLSTPNAMKPGQVLKIP